MVFLRERLNGCYGCGVFTVANTIASFPFIVGIAIISSCIVYWLVGLNDQGDRFPYFFICLGISLMVVESLMMAIAAIVPHFLMGIAAGAGILGMFMLVCGFFQPVAQLPAPVWRYPMHYLSFHSYAFGGFMQNQFKNTNGWGCPPGNPALCTSQDVLDYWVSGVGTIPKWADIGVLVGMVLFYRTLFYLMLKLREKLNS